MTDAAERAVEEPVDDLVADVPPDPPDAAGTADAGTGLVRADESDPYGLEIKGAGDVVHSDLVGAAELSAEYTAGNAADDARTDVGEVEEAWRTAAEDSLDDR
jgi:hypothetical protein